MIIKRQAASRNLKRFQEEITWEQIDENRGENGRLGDPEKGIPIQEKN